MDRDSWLTLLGLGPDEVPQLLVLEGTWWRQRALDLRLPHLTGVRELGMPDLWHGWLGGVPIAYCPAYGAPRAVEPVHVLAVCGTPVVVQVGSCGGLQPHVRTGDVVLSERASIGEGASQYYGGSDSSPADLGLVDRAASLLEVGTRPVTSSAGAPPSGAVHRGVGTRPVTPSAGTPLTGAVHRGATVSTSALLQQPDELVAEWSAAGHLGVDMETSAVFSAAAHFGVRAASLLFVWDELPGRSWTDPFSPAEQAAQAAANAAVFEVALRLA